MLFNSLNFIIFFPIVVLLYYIVPSKVKNTFLLLASYYFYMCWNAKYALLLLFSTIVTFLSGILISKFNKLYLKKIVVFSCLLINLGILFVFKYFVFASSIISSILSVIHIEITVPEFNLLLPVGISFYTFQALGYTIDVYRKDISPEKNFINYALFVSFFPQLVAGPIERSKNLLTQLTLKKPFNYENFREGFLIMLWGYFLKLVLADRIAIFVDTVYGNPEQYHGYYIIVASILFAFQIYCDFAGYSTIAVGAAKILGVQLMDNFNSPYLSVSVAGFWRKWHISLTSWFKDYLYIPLGGNRKGTIRKYINIFIVFFVSGLWHGASISFIIWGVLNGIYQIIGQLLMPIRDKLIKTLNLHRDSFGHKLLCGMSTFILIDISWIFFRSNTFSNAKIILKNLFTLDNLYVLFDGSLYNCGLEVKNYWIMITGLLILLFADICKKKGIVLRYKILNQDAWFRCIFITISIVAILTYGIWGATYNEASFIYFQF